jgi:hypothetical protein
VPSNVDYSTVPAIVFEADDDDVVNVNVDLPIFDLHLIPAISSQFFIMNATILVHFHA